VKRIKRKDCEKKRKAKADPLGGYINYLRSEEAAELKKRERTGEQNKRSQGEGRRGREVNLESLAETGGEKQFTEGARKKRKGTFTFCPRKKGWEHKEHHLTLKR